MIAALHRAGISWLDSPRGPVLRMRILPTDAIRERFPQPMPAPYTDSLYFTEAHGLVRRRTDPDGITRWATRRIDAARDRIGAFAGFCGLPPRADVVYIFERAYVIDEPKLKAYYDTVARPRVAQFCLTAVLPRADCRMSDVREALERMCTALGLAELWRADDALAWTRARGVAVMRSKMHIVIDLYVRTLPYLTERDEDHHQPTA